MEDQNIDGWQIDQARDALKLYIHHFGGNNLSKITGKSEIAKSHLSDCPQIIRSLRDSIRIKHYAYKTERSYIDYVKRFYEYTTKIRKGQVFFIL